MSPIKGRLACQFGPPGRAGAGSIRNVKDCLQRPLRGRLLVVLLGCAGLPAAAQPQPTRPAPAPVAAALAQAVPAADLARALALAQQAAERLAPPGARVTATLGTLDARLKPAPCHAAEPFLPRGTPSWGRTRVGLRCTRGAAGWTLYLPVQVQVQAPALSVRSPLPAGSVLSQADLTTVLVDWSARAQPPLTLPAQALGRTLARAASPGSALHEADLQTRRWFAAGDTVKVLAAGPGFAVATEGRALGEGREGQRVRVQLQPRYVEGQLRPGPVLQGLAVGERLVELL